MHRLAVGQIRYINTLPIYYTILKERELLPFEVVSDVPAALNAMMRGGKLDVSLISSSEYAQAQERYLIHRDFCLASAGYVNSVLLISNKAIQDLDGAAIGLSASSATSSNLIRIMLQEFYGFRNSFHPVSRTADFHECLQLHDAVLVIGDDALQFNSRGGYNVYDMGKLWTELTGFPVVFAIVAVNALSAGEKQDLLSLFFLKLSESHDLFVKHPEEIVAYAQSQSSLSLNFTEYYSHLTYKFTREFEEGLLYYYRMLAKHRLAPPVERIRYY